MDEHEFTRGYKFHVRLYWIPAGIDCNKLRFVSRKSEKPSSNSILLVRRLIGKVVRNPRVIEWYDRHVSNLRAFAGVN